MFHPLVERGHGLREFVGVRRDLLFVLENMRVLLRARAVFALFCEREVAVGRHEHIRA